jgi:hypothetical protein
VSSYKAGRCFLGSLTADEAVRWLRKQGVRTELLLHGAPMPMTKSIDGERERLKKTMGFYSERAAFKSQIALFCNRGKNPNRRQALRNMQ